MNYIFNWKLQLCAYVHRILEWNIKKLISSTNFLTYELRMTDSGVTAIQYHMPESSTAGHHDIISELPVMLCQGNILNIRVERRLQCLFPLCKCNFFPFTFLSSSTGNEKAISAILDCHTFPEVDLEVRLRK